MPVLLLLPFPVYFLCTPLWGLLDASRVPNPCCSWSSRQSFCGPSSALLPHGALFASCKPCAQTIPEDALLCSALWAGLKMWKSSLIEGYKEYSYFFPSCCSWVFLWVILGPIWGKELLWGVGMGGTQLPTRLLLSLQILSRPPHRDHHAR